MTVDETPRRLTLEERRRLFNRLTRSLRRLRADPASVLEPGEDPAALDWQLLDAIDRLLDPDALWPLPDDAPPPRVPWRP